MFNRPKGNRLRTYKPKVDNNHDGRGEFSEKQIRLLLLYCHANGKLGNGKYEIKKSMLRNLLNRLQRNHNTKKIFESADFGLLGKVLNKYDYLDDSMKEEGIYRFKFNMFQQLLNSLDYEEKIFLRSHSMEEKKLNPIVTFMLTMKRNLRHTVLIRVCCICKATVNLSEFLSHLADKHYDVLDHCPIKNYVKSTSKLNVSVYFDEKTLYTNLNVRSKSLDVLEMQSVCICRKNKSTNIYFKSIQLLPDKTVDLPFNRMILDDSEETYKIIFLFKNKTTLKEYIEVHLLKIQDSMISLINYKRKVMARALQPKTNAMPQHESDLKLLKYLDEDFKLPNISTFVQNDKIRILHEYLQDGCNLTPSNYVSVLKCLNEIEDLYITRELAKFSLPKKQCIALGSDIFLINIADDDLPKALSDGDTIILYQVSTNKKPPRVIGSEIKGKIIEINDGKIEFECVQLLSSLLTNTTLKKACFKITFRKEKSSFAMEQEALSKLSTKIIKTVLFPQAKTVDEFMQLLSLEEKKTHLDSLGNYHFDNFAWASQTISKNIEQQKAVLKIINDTSYPAPFYLFGPPGTGKTTTLVEAITQLWKLKPHVKIFVTAYSNYAVDEIAKRVLSYVDKADCFRYYAQSMNRKRDQIDPNLLEISNLQSNPLTSFNVLLSYRIVFCTLTNSGWLPLKGIPKNSFDYIFIDECASATEASAIIPISGLVSMNCHDSKNVKIIVAGDPQQLGPIVCCKAVEDMGLAISMMERLKNNEIYKAGTPSAYTKLLQNFRSHQSILRVPNDLFYNAELISMATDSIANWALNWRYLPNKLCPIIFHATLGYSKRDKDSTSLYNETEIQKIIIYVHRILQEGINGKKLTQTDIGIVTPYKLQCKKIKKKLKEYGWKKIEVGSVEQFQGQERMVIIISTVRSKVKSIGFLSNPKRMNVAITRAQGLLIVVGNPHTLCMDENWGYFVKFCIENNVMTGDWNTDSN